VRTIRLLLWPAGLAVGIAAEWVLYGWSDPRHLLPDLLTGWALIACGLIGWHLRPGSRSGPLMTATGFTWFVWNFTVPSVGAIDWLTGHALYLHRGPLVQLLLTYPRGRASGWVARAAIAVGYACAVVTPVWRSDAATIVLCAGLVLVAGYDYLQAVGRRRRECLAALQATVFTAAVLGGIAVARLADPTQRAAYATLLAYEIALSALAVALLVGLIRAPWERAAVTDLVVELGEARSGTLRDALARALGDPTLEVGYWVPGRNGYVDASGRDLTIPAPGAERRVTRIDRDGQRVAALVHDPSVLEDPGLVEAVAASTRLAASNARLQAAVRAQVAEVVASRRRLLRAGDEERRRLEERLQEGAERRLNDLLRILERAQAESKRDAEAAGRLDRARAQLEQTLGEIHQLARGLHPRELSDGGLSAALASLAERSPVPVDVEVAAGRLPDDVEAALHFACSEALANVAKYASASTVSITVTADDGLLQLAIEDDGVGGADPARGTGLRGLADRIEALGGTFGVDSPVGHGTRVAADLPLDGGPR